ncbi:MAG: ATP-binding cassette domain-containing protein, partial [Rhodospirillales bacterium]|nr:ATP-binding cassette domain-containing protein [Rhodospirillales bacterium]
MSETLLDVRDLDAYYDRSHILQGVSFAIDRGEVMTLLGRNGAGKTTTLKTIVGIVGARRGVITFDGRALGGLATHRIGRAGIAYVPETRDIFASLSVEENLTLAARPGNGDGWTLKRVYDLFPKLRERADAGGDVL